MSKAKEWLIITIATAIIALATLLLSGSCGEGLLMSGLFQLMAGMTRNEALGALKRRAEAEGLIITTCGWCDAYLGEKPGKGVNGISTGICKSCLEEQRVPST